MKSLFRNRGLFSGRRHQPSRTTRDENIEEEPPTTWNEDEGTNFSVGSTAFGDSFVLTIDWESTTMGDSKENEQLYDAYLENADHIQRRLCKEATAHSTVSYTHPYERCHPTGEGRSEENCAEPDVSRDRSALKQNIQLNLMATVAMPSTPLLKNGDLSKAEKKTLRHAARKQIRDLRHQLLGQDPSSVLTAKLFLRLGNAEQQARRYLSAMNSYFQAAAIFRKQKRRVSLATALDLVAVSYCEACQEGSSRQIHEHFQAKTLFQCVTDALNIRKDELGPWHVDTVNSLQHLARLYMMTGQVEQAAEHYLEVVELRRKIYGSTHHGTAVAAHCLGNAYFQLRDVEAALVWYDYAVMVYDHIGIQTDNPAYSQILRDRQLLKCIENDPEQDTDVSGEELFEL